MSIENYEVKDFREAVLNLVKQIIITSKNGVPYNKSTLQQPASFSRSPSIIPYDRHLASFLIDELSREDFSHLLKGLVEYSRQFGPAVSGGSASPVITLYEVFCQYYPDHEPEITAWIVQNRINDYEPFGTIMFKHARSLNEFKQARHQQAMKASEARSIDCERHKQKLSRDSEKATGNLPNAIRRGDIKAIEALFAKGANPVEATMRVGPLCQLAQSCGRDNVLQYLKEKGID